LVPLSLCYESIFNRPLQGVFMPTTSFNAGDIYASANPISSGGGGLNFVTTVDTASVDFTGDGTPGSPLSAIAKFEGIYIIRDDATFRAALAGPESEKVALWLAPSNPFPLQSYINPGDEYVVNGDVLILHSGITLTATGGGRPRFAEGAGTCRVQWGGSALIIDYGINLLPGVEFWAILVNASSSSSLGGLSGTWFIESAFQGNWQDAVLTPLATGGGAFVNNELAWWSGKQPGFDAISAAAITHQGFVQATSKSKRIDLGGTDTISIQDSVSRNLVLRCFVANPSLTIQMGSGSSGGCWFVTCEDVGGGAGTLNLNTSDSINVLGLPKDFVGFVYYSQLTPSKVLSAVSIQNLLATVATTDSSTIDFSGNGTTTTPLSASVVAGSITATELADGAVTTNKLATNAVTTAKIADSNVTTAKLANNAVTLAKLATQGANTVLANATAGTAVPTAVTLNTNNLFGRRGGNIVNIPLSDPEFVKYQQTPLSDATIQLVSSFAEYGVWIHPASGSFPTQGPRGPGNYFGVFQTTVDGNGTDVRDYLQFYSDTTGVSARGGTSTDVGASSITWGPWAQVGATSVATTTQGRAFTYDGLFLSEVNLSASGSFGTRVAHWYRCAISSFLKAERITFFMGQSGGTVKVALYKRTGTSGAVSLVWESGNISAVAGFNNVVVGTPGEYTAPNDQLWLGFMVPQTGSGSFSNMAGRNLNLAVIGPNTLNAEAVTIFKQTQGSDSFPATFTPVVDTASFPSIVPLMTANQIT
jgi:hypothetical protein